MSRWNGLQRQLARSRSLEELATLFREYEPLSRWPAVSHATAWHRLGRFAKPPGTPVAQSLARRLGEALDGVGIASFDARGCANVMHAWAMLQLRERQLPELCSRADLLIADCNEQELANIIYSLGRLRVKAPLLPRACAEAFGR
ncbi:ANK1 [Symbiodinium necroappetens]|uniref:ANK1 protein n=1 Tax=Symbiodinium necroappetens TaxID=1628268 RepID=A0A812KDG2_9DINO|nr:ANK1 [Symbiodinium necroappetens]